MADLRTVAVGRLKFHVPLRISVRWVWRRSQYPKSWEDITQA